MNPVGKALWFIESHFAQEITLDDIAAASGVSRYHMSRAFGTVMGRSISSYMRGRRLTEAARALGEGARDILTVALDAGYGSHEAFTRAFRDQFGVTPETVRDQRRLDNLELVEPIRMDETLIENLSPPRFEDGVALLVTGLSERYDSQTSAGIPAQWQRFGPHLGHIPGQVGSAAYGVCYNSDDEGSIDYLSGVEVGDFSRLPQGFARLRIAPQRYVVFFHPDHISTIRRAWYTIWNKWIPESDYEAADAPSFELYDERFDPRTGTGGFEIWIPVRQ